MTNIIPFPKLAMDGRAPFHFGAARQPYEFTETELDKLGRWYSAMRYAFPLVQGIMVVCHRERASAVGLYGENGAAPNCLISKHDAGGQTFLIWATAQDAPRRIAAISEITEAQIVAIAPPRNEQTWLDAVGWMKVTTERMIAGSLPAALSPKPA